MSVAFVGQGLVPGWTLSNSDMLYSTTPWTASVPEGVRLGGANFELADAVAVFHPFFRHTRSVLPDVPLWNPHVMGGRPYLANAQSAVFSPFTVPLYVVPFWTALAVAAALKLFVAAFGTYLLGRALGMRFAGALLAGVVFAFGTFFVVWLAWPLTNVFPLLPWLVLLTELLVRRPGPLPAAGLAVLVALAFLGGHPESTFHVLVATCAYFAFRLVLGFMRGGRARHLAVRPAIAFALALAAGTAMAAVMLVPLFELLLQSGDYARRQGVEPGHGEAKYLAALFLFDFWGRPTQTPLIGDLVSNRGWYAGAITLMLAAAALVLRPTAMRLALSGFALVVTAVVLGVDPVFSAVTALPGFQTAHNSRMVIFVLFVLSLLAGWGLDDLARHGGRSRRRGRLALGLAAAIFCAPVLAMLAAGAIVPGRLGSALEVAWGFADPPSPARGRGAGRDIVEIVRLSALLQWLVLAGAGLGLVALRTAPRRARLGATAFAGLALAVLVVDLFRANMGFNPAIPVDHAEQPTTGSIRYLQSRAPNRFAALSRPGLDQPLQPDIAMRYGLYDARGYDYPVERRYDTFWRAVVAARNDDFIEPTQRAGDSARAVRGLSLLSVTDLLHYPTGPAPRASGLRLAYAGPDARVYRNSGALPRAFLVGRQRTVRDAASALAATTDPGFAPRSVAITERPLAGLAREGAAADGPPGEARLLSYGADGALIRATARARSLLVLTDVRFPGWKATVDGRPAVIERVNYLLRGVMVPAGDHRVEFRYEPASWRVGWIVSCLAVLVTAAAALVGWRRRPRARGPGH